MFGAALDLTTGWFRFAALRCYPFDHDFATFMSWQLHDCLHHLSSDVLAHRQLAAAIGHSPLHASLHSKDHVERILNVVNRRHRMAQMASRASVEFFVGLALKGRGASETTGVEEEAFVIRTFRNGVGVFVYR